MEDVPVLPEQDLATSPEISFEFYFACPSNLGLSESCVHILAGAVSPQVMARPRPGMCASGSDLVAEPYSTADGINKQHFGVLELC